MREYNSEEYYQEVLSAAQQTIARAIEAEKFEDTDDIYLTLEIGQIHHKYWRQGHETLKRKSLVSLREAVQYMNAIETHNERIKRKPDLDLMFATLVKWTEERDAAIGAKPHSNT